jgi:hypothetical protein
VADEQTVAPESSAVRVALWRALHIQIDPPHVLEDEIGLRLAAPEHGWRQRGDMDPVHTSRFRAGIVARSRFTEDLVAEQAGDGVGQYVILGAGLDTFAQRQPATLRQFAALAPGSTLVMTFAPLLELLDEEDRQARMFAENGARGSGTPWLSSSPRRRLWRWPARPGWPPPGTYRPPRSTSGTSRAAPTAFARRPARNCWSPPPDRPAN